MTDTRPLLSSASVRSGIAAVDHYLDAGLRHRARHVVALRGRRLRGLMRIQSEMGVTGPVVELGTFEGRFFIALCHALAPGETALGIDRFDWPDPQVIDRFEANCLTHGVPPERRITWKADTQPCAQRSCSPSSAAWRPRFMHVDSEHSRAGLTKELELATAVLAPAASWCSTTCCTPAIRRSWWPCTSTWSAIQRCACCASSTARPSSLPRNSRCAAQRGSERYEQRLPEAYKDSVWLMGADLTHWCPVLSLDTRLAERPRRSAGVRPAGRV